MLVPLQWLKEFIDPGKTPDEISHILTMVGLEVEGEESTDGEVVFEVGITPNRPDCLSLLGVARELRAATGGEIKIPPKEVKAETKEDFRVIIDSPLCRRYAGRIIRGVKIGPSPEWMQKRLDLAGLRPINNVVDITNYVLLEFGHPLHAFDLDTLRGGTIRVDVAGAPTRFRTLDGVERELPEETLLIWDGERPVAVAGVMGGQETEVTEKTVNVFLESAYFNPTSIRRTSTRLALKTEASYRFERGTDIEGLVDALDRATYLIKEFCGGKVSEMIDVYPDRFTPMEIQLRYKRVERLLGIGIEADKIREILRSLGFEIKGETETGITVTVPSFRVDIENETDLIEEVARHYGYDNIPSTLPKAPMELEGSNRMVELETVRETVLSSGFHDAINYSFMNPQILDTLTIPEDDDRRRLVELINPLRKEDSVLRTFILPSLLNNLIHNLNQGVRDIKIFELGRVFLKREDDLPYEPLHLGLIYLYTPGQRLWEDRTDVFYIMKGVLEKVIQRLNREGCSLRPTNEPFLHPGRSADIYFDESRVGYVGVLSPEVRKKLDLEELKEDIGVLEIDLNRVMEARQKEIRYKPIPRFPYVRRDIALLIDRSTPAETVLNLIRDYQSDIIEDARVFDLYEGKNIPPDKKSLTFSIIYRATDRTLTDEEVETVHQALVKYLLDKTGGVLRG